MESQVEKYYSERGPVSLEYMTTVYAIKLGHNIILATRTLHSFIPLLCLCFTLFTVNPLFSLLYYVRADCVPDPLVRKPLDLH